MEIGRKSGSAKLERSIPSTDHPDIRSDQRYAIPDNPRIDTLSSMNRDDFLTYLQKVFAPSNPKSTVLPKRRIEICLALFDGTIAGEEEWIPREHLVKMIYGDVRAQTTEALRKNIPHIQRHFSDYFDGKVGSLSAPIIDIEDNSKAGIPIFDQRTNRLLRGYRINIKPIDMSSLQSRKTHRCPPQSPAISEAQRDKLTELDRELSKQIAHILMELQRAKIIPHAGNADTTGAFPNTISNDVRGAHGNRLPRSVVTHVPYKRIRVHVTNEGKAELEVVHMNSAAELVYGVTTNDNQLIGADLQAILDRLSNWMDDVDIQEFVADQERAGAQFARDKYAEANVPMRFNERHPIAQFRNKSLLPVMTQSHQFLGRKDKSIYYAIVAYLDLDLLPFDI